MEKKQCPICPRGCDLSKPHCPRGMRYAKTGEMPKSDHHKRRFHFEKREQQLIMKYLHHAVHVADDEHFNQDMSEHMFDILSEEETVQLKDLLEKLSDHWIDLVNSNNNE